MQPAPDITVRRLPVPEGDPPVCDVLRDGVPTGVSVGGAVLAAALVCAGFYILFMTDDCPFEEGLTIHLLARPDCAYIESVGLALPYAPGHFRDLRVVDARCVAFRFFADEVTLTVLPRRGWRLPFLPEFIGVFRPFGLRRWLLLGRV